MAPKLQSLLEEHRLVSRVLVFFGEAVEVTLFSREKSAIITITRNLLCVILVFYLSHCDM